MDLSIVLIIIQIIFIEGILSIDNAAVLGAMVSILPTDKPVPYPKQLAFLQKITDKLLGMQQTAALKVGLIGAYLGRGLMLVLATWVIENPILKILGAAYLIKLAFDHLSGGETEEEKGAIAEKKRQLGKNFWRVVIAVELADLAFSLDNVVAVVSLSDQLWVVLLGVALGIITMRFAAGIFTWMIKKEPILGTAAYIIVLNIGLELLLSEFFGMHFETWKKFAISFGTIVLCVAYGRIKILQILRPVLRWISQGIGNVNELVNWAFLPVTATVSTVYRIIRRK